MHPGATRAVLRLPKSQTNNTKTCFHVTETTKTTRPTSTRYQNIRKNFGGSRRQLDCRGACHGGRNGHKTTAAPTTSSAPITSRQIAGIDAMAPHAARRHPCIKKPKKRKQQTNSQQKDASSARRVANWYGVEKEKHGRQYSTNIYSPTSIHPTTQTHQQGETLTPLQQKIPKHIAASGNGMPKLLPQQAKIATAVPTTCSKPPSHNPLGWKTGSVGITLWERGITVKNMTVRLQYIA